MPAAAIRLIAIGAAAPREFSADANEISIGSAAALTQRWAEPNATWLTIAVDFSYALVPLGFAMWLAHYSFHFLTSYDVIVPDHPGFGESPSLRSPPW